MFEQLNQRNESSTGAEVRAHEARSRLDHRVEFIEKCAMFDLNGL